jgi:glycerophosphoryl diester phosphodiesterase
MEDRGKTMKVWGHRGCRGPTSPPENSLRAFSAAIAQGADGIELDVFLTRDRQLVVFHDDRLEGLSDGYGSIASHALHELQSVRLKSAGGTLSDEGIPTLSEVLNLVGAWRQDACRDTQHRARAEEFVVNIETKGLGIAAFVAAEVERRLASGWTPQNFLNSSFDMDSLREMRRLLPELPIGVLFEGPLARPAAPWDITLDELRLCIAQVTDIHADTINITLPSVRQAGALDVIRQAGARPVAWTSDEVVPQALPADEGSELIRFLMDNDIILITDFPGPIRALERACRSRFGSE